MPEAPDQERAANAPLEGLPADLHGFVERFDPFTGRAWLWVLGRATTHRRPEIRQRIPMHAADYGALRRRIRIQFGDRPFVSSWGPGTFPPAPAGVPWGLGVAAGAVVGAAVCGGAAWWGGPVGAAAGLVAVAWPFLRLLDHVQVTSQGLRAGPVWSSRVGWHEVTAVGLIRDRSMTQLWAHTHDGALVAPVPEVLVPALRARIRRLGGFALQGAPMPLDHRYAVWRRVAVGIPWGILVAVSLGAWFTPWPWWVLASGLLVVAGTGLLAAAVDARALGWGAGAVGWLSLLYALIVGTLAGGTLLRATQLLP